MKLYELAEQYRTIEGMLDKDYEYIDKDGITKELGNIVDQIEDKVCNIGKLILELKSDAESIKAEEDRLAKRRSAALNKIEYLKNYLLTEMQTANVLKAKKDVISVAVRNNPPSVEVAKFDEVPEQYIRVIPEVREADKKLILQHFKDTGEIVTGVDIITNRKYLEVR